ncbi:MAG: hypothetical protein U1E67_21050 [Hyphomicrobiales bacterium]
MPKPPHERQRSVPGQMSTPANSRGALSTAARVVLYILGGLLALPVVAFVALIFMDDPLDSYELKEVLAEPGGDLHALLYDYVHAESSGQGTTVWIASGAPPALGSRDREGEAAMTWFGPRDALHLA